MTDRIKPIIDTSYPALMAGLCLTFLSISEEALRTEWLVISVSTASLSFIICSFSLFVYSLDILSGKETNAQKSYKEDKSISWCIVKWTFFFGIILLLISTCIVVYNLWFHEFLLSIELSNITNLKNPTNLPVVNQT